MHSFGSTGIVTGYIKQLLADFNLPTVRVYTKEMEAYYEEHGFESPEVLSSVIPQEKGLPVGVNPDINILKQCYFPYIKDGKFQVYVGGYYRTPYSFETGKWQSYPFDINLAPGGARNGYERGQAYLNDTKTLSLKNNVYDAYTHEYLGEYLRFIRDYDKINLMPLYNCFSNNTAKAIQFNKELHYSSINAAGNTITYKVPVSFDSSDSSFRIFAVPVKLFKEYTIAIDSDYPVEVACGVCNNTLYTGVDDWLFKATYKRFTQLNFKQPILYSNLKSITPPTLPDMPSPQEIVNHKAARERVADIAIRESELKLLIKVPKHVTSSIVVLEGNYVSWNDITVQRVNSVTRTASANATLSRQNNHTVLDNAALYSDANIPLITPLQLLNLNTETQLPFANRLLEYLTDNCITGGSDEIRENVLMAQHLASLRHKGELEPVVENDEPKYTPEPFSYDMVNGVWNNSLQKIFYNYAVNHLEFNNISDILGYVDKDIEKYFSATTYSNAGKSSKKTMLTFNVWEDVE